LTAARILYAAEGRLRAPWRLLAFALATVTGLLVAQAIAYSLASAPAGPLGTRLGAEMWLLTLALLIGHALTLRLVDRRGWDAVALDRAAARPRRLLLGLAVGVLAIAVPTAALIAVGWLRIAPAEPGSWWDAAWRLSVFLAPAALWEELAFRGYPFAVLREALGVAPALLATSLLFGLIHLSNPGADGRSTALVVLAGVFLGVVLLATRSLYATWLAHLGWNWTMAVLFHAAVSGQPFPSPGYQTVDAGPDWATGGVWGPEGGAGAALGMTAGMLVLAAWRRPARGLLAVSALFARRPRRGEPYA